MSIENRPAVYFPSMSDDEVIRYAETHAETTLEKTLVDRINKRHEPAKVEQFVEDVRELARCMRNETEAVELYELIDSFEQ